MLGLPSSASCQVVPSLKPSDPADNLRSSIKVTKGLKDNNQLEFARLSFHALSAHDNVNMPNVTDVSMSIGSWNWHFRILSINLIFKVENISSF